MGYRLLKWRRTYPVGVMISSDLKCSQQCKYAYTKASKVMGMIRKTISYKEPKIMLSLYKTLVRPHVEYCSSVWNPHYSKDKVLLERVQHRYTKMILDMLVEVAHFLYCKLNVFL